MRRVLGVSKSGFYAWLKRLPSARGREEDKIAERILDICWQHKGRYGSPGIHQQLRDEGIHVGSKRVIQRMKQTQLVAYYTTYAYKAYLQAHRIRVSISRKGNC